MGRYYNGDVNGKFMFAVQDSNAHERFGAVEYADYKIGMQLKEFFDKNKDCDECRFEAEL
jgi:hypothetical protein